MEHRRFRLRIWEILALVCVIVLLASGVDAIRTQESLSEKVVRLHVLANSDAEDDQALKLKVRDAILNHAEPLLDSVSDRNEAEAVLRGQLLELEKTAAEVIRSAGYSYPVTVELAKTDFPTREYPSFSLPAGEYLALRVLIGEAAGQNWWCVLYPQMCFVDAAWGYTTDESYQRLRNTLTEEEFLVVSALEQKGAFPKIKLKILEFWQ